MDERDRVLWAERYDLDWGHTNLLDFWVLIDDSA